MKCTLRKWQTIVKPVSELIIQASSTNCDDAWQPFPIGMSWQFVKVQPIGLFEQLGSHENLVLCAISPKSDQHRRTNTLNRISILSNLSQLGIQNVHLHHSDYFKNLPSYKFVISPEGNGIDCHRHYEAFFAGCIPIIEKNPLTEEKYKSCPVLWTTDYSELSPAYLESVYQKMLDTEYDFSCLFLSSYPPEVQTEIKRCGNFWLSSIHETNCTWY